MEFTIDKTKLAGPLKIAAAASGQGKKDAAILNHLQIRIAAGGSAIVGSCGDVMVQVPIEPSIKTEGIACVPKDKLLGVVSERDGELKFSEKDGKVVIAAGKAKFSIATNTAEAFPGMPPQADAKVVTLPRVALASIIKRASYAIGAETDTRFTLRTLLLHFKDNVLRVVSTDGHRLAVVGMQVSLDGEMKLMLSKKALEALSGVLASGADDVSISMTTQNIVVINGGTKLFARLVEGNYPDYIQIIPKTQTISASCQREDMLRALRSVQLFGDDKRRVVEMLFTDSKVQVGAAASDVGAGMDEVEAKITRAEGAGDLKVYFNPAYLQEAISSFTGEVVEFRANGELSPVRLAADEDGMAIIMPVRK